MKLKLFAMALLVALTACQPNHADNHSSTSNTQSTPTAQTLAQTQTAQIQPKENTQPQKEKQSTHSLDCITLSNALQKINHNSLIEDINIIDNQLKQCLPKVDNDTQLKLIHDYYNAYERFLSLPSKDMNVDNFFIVMSALTANEKPNPKDLKQLPLRTQYLVKLAEDSTIKPINLCEGDFDFYQNYQNYVDIFVPYLPKDQAVFVKQNAKENQDIFWCDAGIAIGLSELIDRALFWQAFIEKYPDSQLSQQAKYYYDFYTYRLFFGSENSDWLEDDKTKFVEYIDPNDTKTYEQHFNELAKHKSKLGEKAKVYLEFVATPLDEREQKYPITSDLMTDNTTGEPLSDWELETLRLKTALNLIEPDYRLSCSVELFCTKEAQD